MSNPYRHRITAEVTEEQAKILNLALPHGMKKRLFQALIEGVIEVYTKGGYEALAPVISKHITIEQLAQIGSKAAKAKALSELELAVEALKSK